MSESWKTALKRLGLERLLKSPEQLEREKPPTFSTMALIKPRGVLWLIRSRIAEHKERYGGRAPANLILHTGTLRSLFEEYGKEVGIEPFEGMPPVEQVLFGAFEGVPLYHCQCNQKTARDSLVTCDGKDEDL